MGEQRNERPDVFGSSFAGMERVHRGLLSFLKAAPGVRPETLMVMLQCNFREYTEEDHDGQYDWSELCFDGDSEKCFALGVNRSRMFSRPDLRTELVSRVMACWDEAGFPAPVLVRDIHEVKDLGKGDGEMILSVHFYFDDPSPPDAIPDTQYFKIVYTMSSLRDKLERIRQPGP